jgi:hypothetical protein
MTASLTVLVQGLAVVPHVWWPEVGVGGGGGSSVGGKSPSRSLRCLTETVHDPFVSEVLRGQLNSDLGQDVCASPWDRYRTKYRLGRAEWIRGCRARGHRVGGAWVMVVPSRAWQSIPIATGNPLQSLPVGARGDDETVKSTIDGKRDMWQLRFAGK